MEAFGIVDGVDEERDGAPCCFDILESAAVDFFGFEGLHEAFGLGIVVGIAGPAHADGDGRPRGSNLLFKSHRKKPDRTNLLIRTAEPCDQLLQ